MSRRDNCIVDDLMEFIERCRRDDGGYNAAPDPGYQGRSDTAASDIAAATYAAVIARTLGVELPRATDTVAFLQSHQLADGSFANQAGAFDPKCDLAVLYNTTQAVVGLRALGAVPVRSPMNALDRFFEAEAYRELPWYTTSFFPLFYAALGQPFPPAYQDALASHMVAHQTSDGYLGDHVAATFHMAHFFRLVGQPTPRAEQMVTRVLRDQTSEGGWNIREPDWDVHAAFDATFILRQLGDGREECRSAIQRAGEWAMRCRNADGGFGHFPGELSDMDAVYFQFGALWMAGVIRGAEAHGDGRELLGWGHAMPVDA